VHVENGPKKHLYEEQDVPTTPPAQMGLVRIAVCKVVDEDRLLAILRALPIPDDDHFYNCLSWVREAFQVLHDDGKAIKSYLDADDWNDVEACARKYCKRKRDAGRFQDQVGGDDEHLPVLWDVKKIPTFNFWENRETTP
jgi:hypothetical protein